MAKIVYVSPVKEVSGKLSKKDKVCYMVRRAATSNVEMLANPCYTTVCGVRSTLPTAEEIARRTRFGDICKQTQARLQDASKVQADLAAFRQQSDYKTIRQFVWHQVADSLE